MQHNRFITFSKIFTFLIVLGALFTLAACKDKVIEVESISVSAIGDASTITVFHGSLQMIANVEPEDATDTSVVWSVQNGTGSATINAFGMLTAVSNGTVTVKATSVSNDAIMGTKVITLSNQQVVVSSVAVSSAGDATTITVRSGTLQMSALVLPANAAVKTVVWSVVNGTGEATISASGLLTAVSNGTVTVKATATSNALMFDEMVITLSNQEIVAESIVVSSALNAVAITTFGGTLQMTAVVLPANAVDKSVIWSVENGTGAATISANGLLTATANGTVTVKATTTNNALLFDTMVITLSNQEVLISSISVSGYMSANT
ncbi:MAG: Ig-like domain-containing protein, partial [Acholeplasmataceae bacterium]|nr:Ig-like domain-containing protein [Acholeplasmataceae bacterium]